LSFSSSGGISEADMWRITTDITGGSNDFTSNWERSDTTGFNLLGTGMTQSSGIFTFPSTGYYLITFTGIIQSGGAGFLVYFKINTTTDNSNYTETSRGQSDDRASDSAQTITAIAVVKVTNTSNVKVKFNYYSGITSAYFKGHSDINFTYATFIKLAGI
jgi:hypothetical protein